MAQQTAVEWYVSKIKDALIMCDDTSMEMDIRHTLEVLIKKGEQAKEMEKQQIEAAHKNGDGVHDEVADKLAKQYYTETYTNE